MFFVHRHSSMITTSVPAIYGIPIGTLGGNAVIQADRNDTFSSKGFFKQGNRLLHHAGRGFRSFISGAACKALRYPCQISRPRLFYGIKHRYDLRMALRRSLRVAIPIGLAFNVGGLLSRTYSAICAASSSAMDRPAFLQADLNADASPAPARDFNCLLSGFNPSHPVPDGFPQGIPRLQKARGA